MKISNKKLSPVQSQLFELYYSHGIHNCENYFSNPALNKKAAGYLMIYDTIGVIKWQFYVFLY